MGFGSNPGSIDRHKDKEKGGGDEILINSADKCMRICYRSSKG